MPMIIDVTGKRVRQMNQLGQTLQQGLQMGMQLHDRMTRQKAEAERMDFAREQFDYRKYQDQNDDAFRLQQFEAGQDRYNEESAFRREQAARSNSNADRQFGLQETQANRQDEIYNRNLAQENAQRESLIGQITELNPQFQGPVPAMVGGVSLQDMSLDQLKEIFKTERHQVELDKSRTRAETAWRQLAQELELDPDNPIVAGTQAMLDGAGTIEELDTLTNRAYSIMEEADIKLREAQKREADITELSQSRQRVLANYPTRAARASILDRRFRNGDITYKEWWDGQGALMDTTEEQQFRVRANNTAAVQYGENNAEEIGARMMGGANQAPVGTPAQAQGGNGRQPIQIDPESLEAGRGALKGIEDQKRRYEVAHSQAMAYISANGLNPDDRDLVGQLMMQYLMPEGRRSIGQESGLVP